MSIDRQVEDTESVRHDLEIVGVPMSMREMTGVLIKHYGFKE